MKKLAIVVLVCLNVALLGALVARTLPEAKAQARAAALSLPPDYLLMTGHVLDDRDVVYVLDVNSKKLAAWQFDQGTKRLERIRLMRDLAKDFSQ